MPSAAMRSTASAAVSTAAASSSRDRLGRPAAARATRPGPRSAACPRRRAPGGSRTSAGATEMERSPLCPASPPPALRRTVPGRQVELVVHDHDGRRVGRSRTAWPAPRTADARLVHVGGRDGQGHPVATQRGHAGSRARTPFSARSDAPWRCASSSTASDPALCRLPANSAAGVAQPDDQQVRRGAPALGPGEGAAQGLALFARGLGCLPARLGGASPSAASSPSPSAPASSSVTTRGGWPMAIAVSGSTSVVTPSAT